MPKRKKTPKSVESLKHKDAVRRNIPTAEFEPVLDDEQKILNMENVLCRERLKIRKSLLT